MLSNTQLKAIHESGLNTRKDVKARINAQLKRECKFKDCDKSLAFERKDMEFCSKGHSRLYKYRIKQSNRAKKRRYNEKHGIKRKTIAKNIRVTSYATPQSEVELIYENYKEPLKPIPKSKGFGYYGTIAVSADKELVQCHICGNLFKSVSAHLPQHKITAPEYKEMWQLQKTTALIGESTRKKYQEKITKSKGLPKHLQEYTRKVQTGEIKHRTNTKFTLEQRNKLGLCPDQVLEKIAILRDKMGRMPSSDEFREEYNHRYIGSINFQFGSWTNAVHKLGEQTIQELKSPDKEKLLEDLVYFFETEGRIPMTSDFNRGLLRDRGVYNREFGSLNNARVEAGLNAILPMPFGQHIELTPDQYFQYKETGQIPGYEPSKDAIKAKKWRDKKKERLLSLAN